MLTADLLSSVAGIVLSLLFSYVPGVKDWFEGLDGTYKRLVMLALLVVVSGGIFALSCYGVLAGYVECTEAGAWELVSVFVAALIANQGAFLVSPKK
jgi:hypothetical protein